MEFYSEINQRRLNPTYSADDEKVSKLKAGIMYKWKVTNPRNIKFHRKVFALFQMGFQNQEMYSDFDEYRAILTMKSGYFKTIPTDKGVIYLPMSISFSSMTQEKFEEVFEALIIQLSKDLHASGEDILCELNSFM